MLQHNRLARRAHWAHAAVVGVHAVCCGLPALAMIAAAIAGATSGVALLADYFGFLHDILHAHEVQILTLSAALVTIGGFLEARRRHDQGFPLLFGVSVLCFLANVAIVVMHRA